MHNGDEQLTKLSCGCIMFGDSAGSHIFEFCKPHQAQLDIWKKEMGDE